MFLRHSLIIFPAGILLVKMYAWSSYPAGNELCRNRTELRFSVRSFGCALFIFKRIKYNRNAVVDYGCKIHLGKMPRMRRKSSY